MEGRGTVKKLTILSALFALAACCLLAGTVNHIVNTGEGILSSLLLALGCICASVAGCKKKK